MLPCRLCALSQSDPAAPVQLHCHLPSWLTLAPAPSRAPPLLRQVAQHAQRVRQRQNSVAPRPECGMGCWVGESGLGGLIRR